MFVAAGIIDWVLCRIYKKKNFGKALDIKAEDQSTETVTTADAASCEPQQIQLSKFPRICSLSHLWEMECTGTISQLFGDNSYNAVCDNQNIVNSNGNHVSRQLGEVLHQFQGNHVSRQLGEVPQLFTCAFVKHTTKA